MLLDHSRVRPPLVVGRATDPSLRSGVPSTTFRIILASALATAAVACVVESEPRRIAGSGGGSATGGSTGTDPNPGSNGTPPSSSAPILVEVDTDKTMTAAPGEGVGVFVEYAKGGKWHVWWTCDTKKTQQSCDFQVKISVTSGAIANAKTEVPGAAYLDTSGGASSVGAKTLTSSEIHGITFETNAGATITLDARVGEFHDSSFLFFVQDGKVNGGFTGKLTNPLQLVGKSP